MDFERSRLVGVVIVLETTPFGWLPRNRFLRALTFLALVHTECEGLLVFSLSINGQDFFSE